MIMQPLFTLALGTFAVPASLKADFCNQGLFGVSPKQLLLSHFWLHPFHSDLICTLTRNRLSGTTSPDTGIACVQVHTQTGGGITCSNSP